MSIVKGNAIQPEGDEETLVQNLQNVIDKHQKQLEVKNKIVQEAERKFYKLAELARDERDQK